jgi:hypothetical protein
MAGVVVAGATFALVAMTCAPRAEEDSGQSAEPRPITGGRFEASGVTHVPGTSSVLFVDDSRTTEVFLMQLTAAGEQQAPAVALPLGADVTDLEGITWDGQRFYAVGSQSKKTGFDGDGLVRFRFDASARRVEGIERIRGLKAWLAANVAELRGTERRVGDLNIEGLAWDADRGRLLLGLRAPVVDGQALIVPIKLADPAGAFSNENIRVDGGAIRVPTNGAGIRSLEYDVTTKALRLIVGAGGNNENRDFGLLEWDGNPHSAPRQLATFPRKLKPEGISRAVLGGRPVSIIVFDVGRFTIIQ